MILDRDAFKFVDRGLWWSSFLHEPERCWGFASDTFLLIQGERFTLSFSMIESELYLTIEGTIEHKYLNGLWLLLNCCKVNSLFVISVSFE